MTTDSPHRTQPPINPVSVAEAAKTALVNSLFPVLSAAVTFIVFLPALKNQFVNWDDARNLIENQNYRGLGWTQLKWMFTTFHLGPYQPLSWITLGVDYLVWGLDPFGYHLTNVILHSLNAVLFYFLSLKLFMLALPNEPRSDKMAGLRLSALFAALFFSIHPLRVESVAWVSERRDVLSGFFYLLTLLLYTVSNWSADSNRTFLRKHIPPLSAFLLALLSKGIVIPLPAVLIVLDIYPFKVLSPDPATWFRKEYRDLWLGKLPYLLLSLIFGIIGYIGQSEAGAILPMRELGWGQRIAHMLFSAVFYLWKTLLPLNLSPYYKFEGGSAAWQVLLVAFSVLAITGALFHMRRRFSAVAAVWFYYLLTLAPVSGLIQLGKQSAADRYTYLSCMGFALIFPWLLLQASRRGNSGFRRILYVPAFLLVLTALSLLTWRQESVWRNSESLWQRVLTLNPNTELAHNNLASFLAQNNLASFLLEKGELDRAIYHCQETLKIDPGYAYAYNNWGAALFRKGNVPEALNRYYEALKLKPDLAEAHSNLGLALLGQGKAADAIVHFREALRLEPGLTDARLNWGIALTAQGKTHEAAEHYLQMLTNGKDSPEAHNNLGNILLAQDKIDAAIDQFQKALLINPDFAEAHLNLGVALIRKNRPNDAIIHYQKALKIKPSFAQAHLNLGSLFGIQGKTAQGIEHLTEALKINPDLAEAHFNMGIALTNQGKLAEAVFHYQEALRLNPDDLDAKLNLSTLQKRLSIPHQMERR